MPDITMCSNGNECPNKHTCYRWMAIADKQQSYAKFYKENVECIHFMDRYYYGTGRKTRAMSAMPGAGKG